MPQTFGVNVAALPPLESTLYRLNDSGGTWTVQISVRDANGGWHSGNELGLSAEVDRQCVYAW